MIKGFFIIAMVLLDWSADILQHIQDRSRVL